MANNYIKSIKDYNSNSEGMLQYIPNNKYYIQSQHEYIHKQEGLYSKTTTQIKIVRIIFKVKQVIFNI